jgi:hypothetical protein
MPGPGQEDQVNPGTGLTAVSELPASGCGKEPDPAGSRRKSARLTPVGARSRQFAVPAGDAAVSEDLAAADRALRRTPGSGGLPPHMAL